MKIGAVCPQFEIGTDPAVIRDYGQTAEGLGFGGDGNPDRRSWRA